VGGGWTVRPTAQMRPVRQRRGTRSWRR
jgi:hypothetical protein